MTKEDWDKLENRVFYSASETALIRADAYKVRISLSRDNMKLSLFIVVQNADGNLELFTGNEAELTERELEIRNKFYYKKTKNTMNISKIKNSKMKKKEKEYLLSLNKKYDIYSSFFPSFQKLKKQFEKNCESIELIN